MCLERKPIRWQGAAAVLAAAILAGCGSAPRTPATIEDNASRSAAKPASVAAPSLPPAGSGRGGYYQDDGPGDKVPDGLSATPDPEPKIESYASRGNKPYMVFGKAYVPILDNQPFKQRGVGSWYGRKFHGQKTSSGEIYDMYKMSAAHPTLPLPSYARVTNLANGKQVIVRINDRGPFHSDRIIDLSYTAALKLGYLAQGSSELEVDRLLPDEIARLNAGKSVVAGREPAVAAVTAMPTAASTSTPTSALTPASATASATAPAPVSSAGPQAVPVVEAVARPVAAVARAPAPAIEAASAQSRPGAAVTLTDATGTPPKPARVEPVVALPVAVPVLTPSAAVPVTTTAAGPAYYLQLGAFSQSGNADAMRREFEQKWGGVFKRIEVIANNGLHRLFGGPFSSRAEAAKAAQKIQDGSVAKAMIVQK